jgi:hypothetical protein
MNSLLAKVSLLNSLSDFCLNKNVISPFFKNVYTCKHVFGVGTPCSCAGSFSGKEGGIQVLADLAPSFQTIES